MLCLNCFGYLFSLLYYLISAETVLVLNPEKDYHILLSRFFELNGFLCPFTNARTEAEYFFGPQHFCINFEKIFTLSVSFGACRKK